MIKKLICIECPKGCVLLADIDANKLISVSGNECPKGITYAQSEIENPTRILTSTVITAGLSLKMLPVKTDKPIPKNRLLEAMQEIKKIRVDKPVNAGEIIVKNFLGLEVDLIATRKNLKTD